MRFGSPNQETARFMRQNAGQSKRDFRIYYRQKSSEGEDSRNDCKCPNDARKSALLVARGLRSMCMGGRRRGRGVISSRKKVFWGWANVRGLWPDARPCEKVRFSRLEKLVYSIFGPAVRRLDVALDLGHALTLQNARSPRTHTHTHRHTGRIKERKQINQRDC